MAGIPTHPMPNLTGNLPPNEAAQGAAAIFGQAAAFASSSSGTVLGQIGSVTSATTLPSSSTNLPSFNAPGLGAGVVSIPFFVSPTINVSPPPKADISLISAYSSEFLTALRGWMTAELRNGSLGLTAETQDDMFLLGTEKELQALSEEKDKIAAAWAKSNWGKPDGVLLAAQSMADKGYTDKRYAASKAIRLECEKNAIDRLRLAIEKGIVLEQTLMDYAPEMAKALAQAFGAQASAYKAEVKAQIELLDAFVRKYQAVLKGRAAAAKLGAVTDGMDISHAEAEFARDAANAEIAAKSLDLTLNVALSETHLSNMKIAGTAQVGSQLFAGAIAACHAQTHLGASFSLDSRESTTSSYQNTTQYYAETSGV